MVLWAVETEPVELRKNPTESDLQLVIRAVYKQVLGNEHLLECDRLMSGESLLRNREISVRQFVGLVAKSDLYRERFFETNSQSRFIELNFKHLLGRAPQDREEITQHVRIYNEQGYEAEIDSYLYSDEYIQNFGDAIVPYARGVRTQPGLKNVSFNRMFSLVRGPSSSDSYQTAQLTMDWGANLPTAIAFPLTGMGGYYSNTQKRFRIEVTRAGIGPRVKRSNKTYEVGYDQLSANIQSIQKAGGKIRSIIEVH